jgi:iron complex transport system ATP-binding protein
MQFKENIDTTLLTTENLSIGYRNRKGEISYLQRDLNLKLFKGELICLIGPNGCGKSTLIRTLATLQSPLEGNILIEETDINSFSHSEITGLISVVLTDKSAVDNITVAEISALGRYQSSNWLGTLNDTDQKLISQAIMQVGLSGFENRMYGTLSDGEKQRAFIAKALSSYAPIMLLDEPTAHLDIPNRAEIMILLRRLAREECHSVLLSTHELDLALQLADEVWLMLPKGEIYTGTPEELLHSGFLDEAFGNEILRFNPHSGSYCVKTTDTDSVLVEGKGELYDMTLQALHRMGYSTEKTNELKIRIIVGEDNWMLDNRGEDKYFSSLSETCRYLKKLTNGRQRSY